MLHPRWAGPDGWRFEDGKLSTIDHVGHKRYLHEIYCAARPDYTGRVTVPVLWDKKTSTIVTNESSQIIRILNSAFDEWGDQTVDFYPPGLRAQIDALNSWIIPNVSAGVYRAGFAADQDAYDTAVQSLFRSLDELEKRLAAHPYLCGETVTETVRLDHIKLHYYDAIDEIDRTIIPVGPAFDFASFDMPQIAA